MKEIYLDNSATTKVCSEAVEKMIEMMTENYGNPSSLHRKGYEAQKELEDVRKTVFFQRRKRKFISHQAARKGIIRLYSVQSGH